MPVVVDVALEEQEEVSLAMHPLNKASMQGAESATSPTKVS